LEVKTLDFVSQLKEVEELNPSFATGMMRICYHGKNRNGWVIPKATLEAAIPTFFNCPIVARYDRKKDKVGAHDMELVSKKGKLKLIPATQPVGVIPTNNMYFWETVKEDDGNEHEYLVMPVILWRRQEAVDHIVEAQSIAQSMECVFDEVHVDENGATIVDKLTMQAFCLLESAKPCFESAAVDVLSSALQEQFSLMKSDWKELCGSENFSIKKFQVKEGGLEVMQEDLINEMNPTMEEVNDPVEPVVETPAEQGVEHECEDIDAEVVEQGHEGDPVTEEVAEHDDEIEHGENLEQLETQETGEDSDEHELEQDEHLEEVEDAEVATEDESGTAAEAEVSETFAENEVSVFATYEARRRALEGALPEIRKTNEENQVVYSEYYWLEDFDDSYAYVGRRIYTAESGESDKRDNGRFAYTINENGEADLSGEFEPMIVRWLTVAESASLDKERAEVANLKQWYEQYQKERVMSLCKEFENLSEVEGFSSIVDAINGGTLDYDAAQEKFFALKGKHVFSLEQRENKVVSVPIAPIETFTVANKGRRYGGIISEHN